MLAVCTINSTHGTQCNFQKIFLSLYKLFLAICRYFHSIPFLLNGISVPLWTKIALFVTIEVIWNIFPSNAVSSIVLLLSHVFVLWAIWARSAPFSSVCVFMVICFSIK